MGPGHYKLGLQPDRDQVLDVTNEVEIVRDLQVRPSAVEIQRKAAESLKSGTFTGQVVGPEGAPVGGASIVMSYLAVAGDPRGIRNSRKAIPLMSDADGKFRTERLMAPMVLVAISADSSLATRKEITGQQESTTIAMTPSATIVGRLFDGEMPVADAEMSIELQLRQANARGGQSTTRLSSGNAVADAGGRFALKGLIVGEQYNVAIRYRGEMRSLKIERAGQIDLGYVDAPEQRHDVNEIGQAWTHIDVPARMSSRFNSYTAIATRISTALADANREYRRVMLVLGDPDSNATRAVFRVLDRVEDADDLEAFMTRQQARRRGDPEIPDEFARTMADFQRVHINIKDQVVTDYLARVHQIDVAKLSLPALVILGNAGQAVRLHQSPPAGHPPQVDVVALRKWVTSYALPARGAEELLTAAVARARDEKKRVLVQQSSPHSYPSRLLTRFIDDHRELLERDYVYANIEPSRMTNGDAVMAKYRPQSGAAPWMAILDADGAKLADSDSPAGNIGFPSEPDAINYFIDKMLKPTAQRLTTQELEELRTALQGK